MRRFDWLPSPEVGRGSGPGERSRHHYQRSCESRRSRRPVRPGCGSDARIPWFRNEARSGVGRGRTGRGGAPRLDREAGRSGGDDRRNWIRTAGPDSRSNGSRVIDRNAPGLAEAMRSATFGVNPHGMLSRAVAGISGATLVVNLPGSVAGVEESLAVIGPALSHAVALLSARPSDHASGGGELSR